jgi:uncharacterized membrane protein (DUF2068 family)
MATLAALVTYQTGCTSLLTQSISLDFQRMITIVAVVAISYPVLKVAEEVGILNVKKW